MEKPYIDFDFGQFADEIARAQCKDEYDKPIEIKIKRNYCDTCDIYMTLCDNDYKCDQCGLVQPNEDSDLGATSNSTIRITTGHNKGKIYNMSDPIYIQQKAIMDQLTRNNADYAGNKFQQNLLKAVAEEYCRIKQLPDTIIDKDDNIIGHKKKVRRSNIKDEMLAALIEYEGIKLGIVRKALDISAFMKLDSGFVRGQNVLKCMAADGIIELPADTNSQAGFAVRYLEAVGLDQKLYHQFILDIIERSISLKIGLDSQISSKTVGCIWIVIVHCRKNITSQQLEKATDWTKANTFRKYYTVIISHLKQFADIFKSHGIPLLPPL